MLQTGGPVLLERDRELERLERLAEDARGGRGRMVVVEGPAGIGKTSLLEAVRSGARENGMTVLHARASEIDRELPFSVVRQLFERLLANADPERRGSLLRGAAAPAEPLVSGAALAGGPSLADADPSVGHFHALYWLVANLADEAPPALAIDDLQWADASSLRFLAFLLPRLEELPVLVAAGIRTSEPVTDQRAVDAIATDPLTTVVRPEPLTDAGVGELIVRQLGAPPESAFRTACRDVTGGNPFLLGELLRELAGEGVAPDASGAAVVRQVAPPAVARAVILRLARLGDSASRLARAVAVLGDGSTLARAAGLADIVDAQEAEAAVAALADAGILSGTRPLAFGHPILRAAVYADIEPAERDRLHRRAAALLEREEAGVDAVAVHLLVTEPSGDAGVAATLRAAAVRALERGAAASAVTMLRRAVAEPPPAAERGPLMLSLASAEFRAGDPAAAVGHFREGSDLTPDPRLRAKRASEWGYALQAVGRHDEGFAVRERAADEVADVNRELALSLEAGLIASGGLDMSRSGWAIERLERHRDLGEPRTPAEAELVAIQAHHDGRRPDSTLPAAAVAERASAAIKILDAARRRSATPYYAALEVLMMADRSEEVRRTLDRAIDNARRDGSAPLFCFLSCWRCLFLSREGELRDAEADGRTSAGLALPQGWFVMAPVMLGYILEALIDRGELADAADLLERSGFADRGPDDDLTLDPVVHARVRLRVARGDVAGARADLRGLTGRPVRWNTYPTRVPAVLVAPELAPEDRDQARAEAERTLREARIWDTPRAIGMALVAAGLVEPEAGGIELLEEATAVLEPSPARLEYARALTELGAALRRRNQRAAARDPLRRALDVADACGARPLAERARQELRAAGGRPRRPRASGIDALTASERRIAAMAAEGLSNPEIAQALFVTKKTVEAHLGNAYRKLGIRSRAQLPAALRKPERSAPDR